MCKSFIDYLEKQKEQSITANDLDEEIHRFFDDCIEVHDAKIYGVDERVITVDCYEITARHFAEFTHHETNESLKDAVTHQMEDDGDIDDFVRKGIDDVVLKYAKLGAKWQKEHKPVDFPTTDEEVNEFLETHPKVEVPEKYKTPDFVFKKKEYESHPIISKDTTSVKSAEWSEEDEQRIAEIEFAVMQMNTKRVDTKDKCLAWLESLPERFNLQPKQEWSEENEKHKQAIIDAIQIVMEECGDAESIEKYKDDIDWFENRFGNLRSHPHWKPSEEQIGALDYAYCELFKREDVGHNILGPLQELLDNLRN